MASEVYANVLVFNTLSWWNEFCHLIKSKTSTAWLLPTCLITITEASHDQWVIPSIFRMYRFSQWLRLSSINRMWEWRQVTTPLRWTCAWSIYDHVLAYISLKSWTELIFQVLPCFNYSSKDNVTAMSGPLACSYLGPLGAVALSNRNHNRLFTSFWNAQPAESRRRDIIKNGDAVARRSRWARQLPVLSRPGLVLWHLSFNRSTFIKSRNRARVGNVISLNIGNCLLLFKTTHSQPQWLVSVYCQAITLQKNCRISCYYQLFFILAPRLTFVQELSQ